MAKNIVEHKGYVGEVFFDDGTLHVKALHLRDALIAEVEDGDVQHAFQELIDDYLELCDDLGRSPNKAFSGSFNVRVSEDIHRTAATNAAKQNISMSQYVELAIRERCIRDSNDDSFSPAELFADFFPRSALNKEIRKFFANSTSFSDEAFEYETMKIPHSSSNKDNVYKLASYQNNKPKVCTS
ncbi:type II toxin-antitoxin system HicB family antitoxin [Cohaesibacter sp. CAU 1516]|uniref:type II toxin-antitoxin system HicB family antitoxin n=1 Tax=Cohaesibacter sp. CAU 1516 TaxID=2576038 RepID=UPI0010FF5B7C|nr:type II toxin-antitoxin system HicB family antitoxin [Cohaesibacter sp. CAU 1516]TLP48637.1 type II toxin-antitoxin system HicB family antitoxin [Cohaesibacter sp. CAU 1516]